MKNTVTHLAGIGITVGNWGIQRCSICGEKIVDTRGQCAPEGESSQPLFWGTGAFVQVTVGENPQRFSMLPPSDKLPEDSCVELVE